MGKGFKIFFSIAINTYKSLLMKVENHWKAIHPKSFDGYSLIKNGLNYSLIDLNTFLQTRTKFMTGKHFPEFTRNELTIFRKFPPTMIKTVPIFMSSLMPGSMLILPLLFVHPRLFLTSNFWTENQKSDFFQKDLNERLQYVGRLAIDVKKQISKILNDDANEMHMSSLCLKLLNEKECEVTDLDHVSDLIDFFEKHLHLYTLPIPHMGHLKKCYPISWNALVARREKLRRFITFIAYEDIHLQRENIETLSRDDLYDLCMTRGFNPYTNNKEVSLKFLTCWIKHSCKANVDCYSFRLHLILIFSRNFQNKFQNTFNNK